MVDLFPKDKPRQFLMAVFLVLAMIEFARASLIWAVIDIIFALSFSPRVKMWIQRQWYRISRKWIDDHPLNKPMKKDFEILRTTHVRVKWWRVDYLNKEGKIEFETVEALDSNEAYKLTLKILLWRYKDPSKKLHKKKGRP